MTSRRLIYPIILSGGAGTRMWPLSRELYPKQLLALVGAQSMIQETALRAIGADFAPPVIVCNEAHRFIIAEQLRQCALTPRAILLEPVARNTAAAVAVAAAALAEEAPDAMMLVLPSDHVIQDHQAFIAAVEIAARAAAAGNLVTFGITPTAAETGYGYIRQGLAIAGIAGAYAVERFVEKPDLATAQSYLAAGGWSWNSGMFLFPIAAFQHELRAQAPQVAAAAAASVAHAKRDLDFLRLDRASFERSPSISIDYAVMEKTMRAVVVPAALGWSDVGSWSALWEIGARDGDGNVKLGDVVAERTHNSYLRSEHRLLATVGLDDMVVVALKDAVLVAAKSEAQHVKAIVERLKQAGRSEATTHARVYRPWGSHETIDVGPRFQVKRIIVNPGHRISLQKHTHRAEHWVCVQGVARVIRDDDILTLRENMSIYLSPGCVHALENPGSEPVHVIEVQSGSYLGDDDIVRIPELPARV